MSLNSSYLDAFYACARLGHFTKAAAALHITQSALSQRIKNLEEELGNTLIIRDRAGLRLTEQGHELLRYCQSKAAVEEQVLSRVQGRSTKGYNGTLRIGAFSSIASSVVLPALANLLETNPGLRLQLIVRELYELRPLLKSGQIDFMIIDEELQQESIRTRVLGFENYVLIQKRGYKGPDIYLDHDEEDSITIKYLKQKTASKLQRHYLDDISGIIEGVHLGLGRAVVPQHLTIGMRSIEILEPKKMLSVPVVLHFYEQSFYSPLQQAVMETLVEKCAGLL
jgi:DNA-binding transcriptional LysR family regulator